MTDTAAVSKSERVYRHLREGILAGTYPDGYRIVLDKVARELEVSPVPVREAVRRLEAEGLVVFTRNVGAQVAGINPRDYADAMQTLAYLEGAATSLAAAHLTPAHLAEAGGLNEQMRELTRADDFDPVSFTTLNEQFHRLLCAPCPNRHLLDLVHREWHRMSLIRRSSFGRVPSRPAVSVAEHDALLDLLRQGAPAEQVEGAARAHKLRTMGEFLSLSK